MTDRQALPDREQEARLRARFRQVDEAAERVTRAAGLPDDHKDDVLRVLYGGEKLDTKRVIRRRSHRRTRLWVTLAASLASLMFLASLCVGHLEDSFNDPLQVLISRPGGVKSPPRTPMWQIVYEADWSNGLAGWDSRTPGWIVENGILRGDGSAITTIGEQKVSLGRLAVIEAPYDLNLIRSGMFIVESDIRVEQNGRFGFFFLRQGENDMLSEAIKYNDNSWHRYKIEVKNREISIFYDDVLISRVSDEMTNKNRVGLFASGAIISARSFRITALM